MPAQYVKAYVKRNKNDAADAEAICEAVLRPTMRFVPVKTAEQQAALLLHRGRERLVCQRTMMVNALRAHLAEFGVIAPRGLRNVGELIAITRDESDARLPGLAQQVLQVLAGQIEQIEAAIAALEKQLMAWHRSNPVSQRLATIPGIGPIIATAIAATVVDPIGFRSGREFAAWLGLVPRQNSTGGKTRLGGISKRGNQIFATAADQRRERQSAAFEGDQYRPMGDWAAPTATELGRGGGACEQDGAHRLGGDAPTGGLPARGRGGLSRQAAHGSLRESNDA